MNKCVELASAIYRMREATAFELALECRVSVEKAFEFLGSNAHLFDREDNLWAIKSNKELDFIEQFRLPRVVASEIEEAESALRASLLRMSHTVKRLNKPRDDQSEVDDKLARARLPKRISIAKIALDDLLKLGRPLWAERALLEQLGILTDKFVRRQWISAHQAGNVVAEGPLASWGKFPTETKNVLKRALVDLNKEVDHLLKGALAREEIRRVTRRLTEYSEIIRALIDIAEARGSMVTVESLLLSRVINTLSEADKYSDIYSDQNIVGSVPEYCVQWANAICSDVWANSLLTFDKPQAAPLVVFDAIDRPGLFDSGLGSVLMHRGRERSADIVRIRLADADVAVLKERMNLLTNQFQESVAAGTVVVFAFDSSSLRSRRIAAEFVIWHKHINRIHKGIDCSFSLPAGKRIWNKAFSLLESKGDEYIMGLTQGAQDATTLGRIYKRILGVIADKAIDTIHEEAASPHYGVVSPHREFEASRVIRPVCIDISREVQSDDLFVDEDIDFYTEDEFMNISTDTFNPLPLVGAQN